MSHQKKQCFKCNFEKSCDGLGLLSHTGDKPKGSLKPPYCDVMEISEYDRLVAKETKTLQVKVTAVIDEAIKTMGMKQTELLDNIKLDPRNSEMETIQMKLVLQTSKMTQNEYHEYQYRKMIGKLQESQELQMHRIADAELQEALKRLEQSSLEQKRLLEEKINKKK